MHNNSRFLPYLALIVLAGATSTAVANDITKPADAAWTAFMNTPVLTNMVASVITMVKGWENDLLSIGRALLTALFAVQISWDLAQQAVKQEPFSEALVSIARRTFIYGLYGAIFMYPVIPAVMPTAEGKFVTQETTIIRAIGGGIAQLATELPGIVSTKAGETGTTLVSPSDRAAEAARVAHLFAYTLMQSSLKIMTSGSFAAAAGATVAGEVASGIPFIGGAGKAVSAVSGATMMGIAILFLICLVLSIAAALFIGFKLLKLAFDLMLTLIEFYIMTALGVIFLAGAGSTWTDTFAKSAIQYGVTIGIQMFSLFLVFGLADQLIKAMELALKDIPANIAATEAAVNFPLLGAELAVLLVVVSAAAGGMMFAWFIGALSDKLPDIARALISGGTVTNGSRDSAAMAMGVAGMAASGISAGASALNASTKGAMAAGTAAASTTLGQAAIGSVGGAMGAMRAGGGRLLESAVGAVRGGNNAEQAPGASTALNSTAGTTPPDNSGPNKPAGGGNTPPSGGGDTPPPSKGSLTPPAANGGSNGSGGATGNSGGNTTSGGTSGSSRNDAPAATASTARAAGAQAVDTPAPAATRNSSRASRKSAQIAASAGAATGSGGGNASTAGSTNNDAPPAAGDVTPPAPLAGAAAGQDSNGSVVSPVAPVASSGGKGGGAGAPTAASGAGSAGMPGATDTPDTEDAAPEATDGLATFSKRAREMANDMTAKGNVQAAPPPPAATLNFEIMGK